MNTSAQDPIFPFTDRTGSIVSVLQNHANGILKLSILNAGKPDYFL